jgi:hypothetical protein
MVIAIRLIQGRRITRGDRSHFHHQISDRWPRLTWWRVPWLWTLAALSASAAYVGPAWRFLPFLGVGLIALNAIFFLVLSTTERERGGSRPGLSLPAPSSAWPEPH